MAHPNTFRRLLLLRSQPLVGKSLSSVPFRDILSHYATATTKLEESRNSNDNKWFALPPYTETINGAVLGNKLARARSEPQKDVESPNSTTALKWVLRCCPGLPRNLVQKLFRLRQVRREYLNLAESDIGVQSEKLSLKRVAAKDSMVSGDRIYLPITVQELPIENKKESPCSVVEVNFIRSLVLYKDPAIIVVNKPPGLAVQGGIGIKRSLDELAATCLSYDYSEPPRLNETRDELIPRPAGCPCYAAPEFNEVHRLDRDSSGILVMGRTQASATVLHSVFREKTFGASKDVSDNHRKVLVRKYWALVIGSPRKPKGIISAPLGKVVVDSGKSDRITVVRNSQNFSSQHAVTKYEVIGSSSHGYTWLELSPLTGRKHQLRVHCAEVLGTPIVGDYKYGWQSNKNWEPVPPSNNENNSNKESPSRTNLPFGLNIDHGSIFEKHPSLHLHCRQMILPNISQVLQKVQLHSDYDLSQLESLDLIASLPSYMQRSWDTTNP